MDLLAEMGYRAPISYSGQRDVLVLNLGNLHTQMGSTMDLDYLPYTYYGNYNL